ncbi:MAG TPA: hypothetical protein VGD64_13445 [Acidisarcina sp.]
MKLKAYEELVSLCDLAEVERVCYLAFFHLKMSQQAEFSVGHALDWLSSLNYPTPNKSRLRANLRSSKATIAGGGSDSFRLHRDFIAKLESEIPTLTEDSEDVADKGTILPTLLYMNTRGFVESLSKQINASFENHIFDGCAVLMRRLMEILLILTYEQLGVADKIKGADGNYVMLERILDNAKSSGTLSLSRNSKETVEEFRKLGNFSAHKIHYNCKGQDIKRVQVEYRALFEELLYKSGIKV